MRFRKRSLEAGGGQVELTLPDDEPPAAGVRLWERSDGQQCIGIEFDGKLVLLEPGYASSVPDTEQLASDLRDWLSTARWVQMRLPAIKA